MTPDPQIDQQLRENLKLENDFKKFAFDYFGIVTEFFHKRSSFFSIAAIAFFSILAVVLLSGMILLWIPVTFGSLIFLAACLGAIAVAYFTLVWRGPGVIYSERKAEESAATFRNVQPTIEWYDALLLSYRNQRTLLLQDTTDPALRAELDYINSKILELEMQKGELIVATGRTFSHNSTVAFGIPPFTTPTQVTVTSTTPIKPPLSLEDSSKDRLDIADKDNEEANYDS